MKEYEYIGPITELRGCRALGRWEDNKFLVQFHNAPHPYNHMRFDWYIFDYSEFREINEN